MRAMIPSFGLSLLVAASFASCIAPTPDVGVEVVSYKTLISRNLIHLNQLQVGMTKAEVFEVMGDFAGETIDSLVPNPFTTEPFVVGSTPYEALHYLTRKYPPFTRIKLSQATPVVLRDGRVIGWGAGVLEQAQSGGYEDSTAGEPAATAVAPEPARAAAEQR
jgi:hypothetical protein